MPQSKTPIWDFVQGYAAGGMHRLHMPGHKGTAFVGCERLDITEVAGADALYEAEGIIAQSEEMAASLFGSRRTLFSTEGSSQCIRAMIHLAAQKARQANRRPRFLAARNAHKAFLYALALEDADVTWLWPKDMHSVCSCEVTPAQVENALRGEKTLPAAVYLTGPDYLGGEAPIAEIASVCHRYGVPLLVDQAHGAYLHFLDTPRHALDQGADLCCDSAHKTLTALTGGAYLHVGQNAPQGFAEQAKAAMVLYGSTSPSYLTLASLDLCNAYLAGAYRDDLRRMADRVQQTRARLEAKGWRFQGTEPMKLTLCAPMGQTGQGIAQALRAKQIECEYADEDNVVFMCSAQTTDADLDALAAALGENRAGYGEKPSLSCVPAEQRLSVREAVFAASQQVRAQDAVGRICAAPTVGCPPAIPIVVSGEVIDESAVQRFAHYGIDTVSVVK